MSCFGALGARGWTGVGRVAQRDTSSGRFEQGRGARVVKRGSRRRLNVVKSSRPRLRDAIRQAEGLWVNEYGHAYCFHRFFLFVYCFLFGRSSCPTSAGDFSRSHSGRRRVVCIHSNARQRGFAPLVARRARTISRRPSGVVVLGPAIGRMDDQLVRRREAAGGEVWAGRC